jgi:hypothetical protein
MVVKSRNKIHKEFRSEKPGRKKGLYQKKQTGFKESRSDQVFPDDLLDELLSKWL